MAKTATHVPTAGADAAKANDVTAPREGDVEIDKSAAEKRRLAQAAAALDQPRHAAPLRKPKEPGGAG